MTFPGMFSRILLGNMAGVIVHALNRTQILQFKTYYVQ